MTKKHLLLLGFVALLVITSLFCILGCKLFSNKISSKDFLLADGTQIISKKGDKVRLRGVNLGGWLVQETWMCPVKGSKAQVETIEILIDRFGVEKAEELLSVYEDNWITTVDLNNLQEIGINIVRVPFGYWNLQTLDGTWKRDKKGEIDFSRLDWIVNECGKRGIYVILDLHGTPGFASDSHSSGKVNSSMLFDSSAVGESFRDATVDLWREVARHFRGNPTVAAYDVINEPMAKTSDEELWELYDRIYQAIREIDSQHLISFEAVWEIYNLPDPSEYGWKNVLYQTHDYAWNGNIKDFSDTKIVNAMWMDEYNVPLIVGEFTGFYNPSDWEYMLSQYDKAGVNWILWTYKLTKKGVTGWALYSSAFVKAPNVLSDSFEEIRMCWSEIGTNEERYSTNKIVIDSIKESLENPLSNPIR